MWQHYEYNASENKSICNGQEVCGREIPGNLPRNLRHHIRIVYPEVYATLLEKEEAAKTAKVEKTSTKLGSSLKASYQKNTDSSKSGKHYDKSSK